MKNASIVACVFFLCSLGSVQVHAQQEYTVVYDLYYNLMLYPEDGDDIIQQNQELFDSQFYDCMNVVQNVAYQASREHMAYCNGLANQAAYSQCIKEDEGGKIVTWGRRVLSVIRGEVRWFDTDVAQAAILAKKMMNSIMGPGAYEQMIKGMVPQWRGLLVCK